MTGTETGAGKRADGRTTVVVPCYDEAARLDPQAFLSLACSGLHILFVDDGSTDGTGALLEKIADGSPAIDVMSLSRNAGKAEAVRLGLRHALDEGSRIVGYYDADLATPPGELLRLVDSLRENPGLAAVFGARVARMGSRVVRRRSRHYLGRVYATVASLVLGITVYDTQCGAKVFRATPALRRALDRPFRSGWSFDVELCDRLLRGGGGVAGLEEDAFLEVPLEAWADVSGSKFRFRHGLQAVADLGAIALEHRRHHAGAESPAERP
jgi:glycosyltransferase involved in cell wall biosynthesis